MAGNALTTGEWRDKNRKMTAVVRKRRGNGLFHSQVTTFSLRKEILSLNANGKKNETEHQHVFWFPRIKKSKPKLKKEKKEKKRSFIHKMLTSIL